MPPTAPKRPPNRRGLRDLRRLGGIYLEASNDDAVIIGNRIHDQIHYELRHSVSGARATISGNTVVSNFDQYGISFSGSQDVATGNDISGGLRHPCQ